MINYNKLWSYNTMNAKEFLINLSQAKECKDIEYKCFSIQKPMGLYNSKKKKINQIDPFSPVKIMEGIIFVCVIKR